MTVLESRLAGSIKSAAIVAGWVAASIAALTGSSLAIAWAVTAILGSPITRVDNILIGLVVCLATLLVVGYFHLRKETVQLRVSDRATFQSRMQIILQDLGYQLVAMTETHWRTRPQFRAFLFGGGIALKLDGSKASLTGPRLSLQLIRRRYRMVSQLDKVQESISDSKLRIAETYLKRVELSLRLEPEHMNEFQSRIVDVLAENGRVLVDVQLMLFSEDGMKESLWINEMRPWLQNNRIPFEYHRDLPQRATVAASAGDLCLDSCIDTRTWS